MPMDGDWFFHCHILYHMMSGMGRVFSYQNQQPNPLIPNPKLAQRKLFADDRRMHFMIQNDFANNGNDGEMMLQNTRWSIGSEWRLGYNDTWLQKQRHISEGLLDVCNGLCPLLVLTGGTEKLGHNMAEKIFWTLIRRITEVYSAQGFNYTLPMLIRFQSEVLLMEMWGCN